MNSSKVIELKPIKETTEDFDVLEQRIKLLFKTKIYFPLLMKLAAKRSLLKNSIDDLADAINEGTIMFSRGQFRGKFNASISRELKELGAVWDRKYSAWRIPLRSLPMEIRAAISGSEFRFNEKIAGIDSELAKILPEEIAGSLKAEQLFDRTLWKTDRAFHETVQGLTVAPKLTDAARKRIAVEWENNLKLYIKNFTNDEVLALRQKIKKAVYTGNRYETLLGTIQKSYQVSANKARFLAKQETSLLMAAFRETRYKDAGLHEYKWGCVAGSKNHPVRPSHKILEGKVFTWDNPPITTAPGQPQRRNNPGQDYGCRCFPRVVVRFQSKK